MKISKSDNFIFYLYLGNGKYKDLIEYMGDCKIIPYIVFYAIDKSGNNLEDSADKYEEEKCKCLSFSY